MSELEQRLATAAARLSGHDKGKVRQLLSVLTDMHLLGAEQAARKARYDYIAAAANKAEAEWREMHGPLAQVMERLTAALKALGVTADDLDGAHDDAQTGQALN